MSARMIVDFGDWPGRIIFGRGSVGRLHEIVARTGGTRALVICGRTIAHSELLTKVKAGLGESCAAVFSDVRPHTPVEMVQRCLDVWRDAGADVLLTVGGGSAIDAGKALQIMLATGGDLERYAIRYAPGGVIERKVLPARAVPHVAVPTTAGSASDVMPTAGVRDPQSRRKLLFWDDDLTPSATVIDPEMAVLTSGPLTAATGMTAMARAIEALYSGKRQPISTGLALHAIRLLHGALPRSIEVPNDLDARAACQIACTMSGMAAINAMASVVHAIGHIVGGRYGLQHGVSHAILLAPAMRQLLRVIEPAQSSLLLDVLGWPAGGAADGGPELCADAMEKFVARLPLPQRLSALGVREDELPEIAHLTMSDYMMANLPHAMTEDDVLALLCSVW